MKNYKFSQEEIQELKAAHKSAKNLPSRIAYRIHVIILFGMEMSPSEISEILFLDEDTIISYFEKYANGGLNALLRTEYKGSAKKLIESQIEILCEELDANIHLTTKSVCQFVFQEFGVEYSERGMAGLLKSIGYVYKKPDLKPGDPDEHSQEIFLSQFVDFLKNKSDSDIMFFMDAVHPVHNTQAAYGWFKKGEKRKIKSNSGRDRYNIHGAMNAETYEVTAIFTEDNVNATATIDLLQALEKSHGYADRIFVLLDNAKYHFSSVVQEYVKNTKIILVPLPTYSPELNLIERFWKLFKKKVIYNKHYPTFSDFKRACLDFFKLQHEYKNEVFSIMGDGLFELDLS